jgi:hypothetical protein
MIVSGVGPLQIAAFTPSNLAQLDAIERGAERGIVLIDLDINQAPSGRCFGVCGTQVRQKFLAGELHGGEVPKTLQHPFHLALTQGAFLGEAVDALGEGVKLFILGQQFYADTPPCFLPRLFEQVFFQAVQMSL